MGRPPTSPPDHDAVTPTAQAVVPIDLVTDTAGKPIDLTQPHDQIVISPDGKTAYAINAFRPGQ